MPEGSLPAHHALPEPAPVAAPDPLILRLEDLPAYGSSDVEPAPIRTRLLLAGGLLVAVLLGAALGLRPWYQRQQLKGILDRQIAAGEYTAAQTTLDQFADAFPEHPDFPRYHGQVLLGQAKLAEAEAALAPHVARTPADIAAGMALGYVYGVDQIMRTVPMTERDLRRGMLTDWTRLFGYRVSGLDPAQASLDLKTDSGPQVLAVLRRTKAAEGADAPTIEAALAAMELLQATTSDAREAAFAKLQGIDGTNLPSFQSYLHLAENPVPDLTMPPMPPLAHVPPAVGLPDAPPPGSIEPLDGSVPSDIPMPSPNLPLAGRGAGSLSLPPEAASGLLENGTPAALGGSTGAGPTPRIRPVNFEKIYKVNADGTEEERWYALLINIDAGGNQRVFVGDTIRMPGTGYEVTIRSIDPEKRRVVLAESDRAVYVWSKPPGSRWYWDTTDPENDFGGLRKAKYGNEQR